MAKRDWVFEQREADIPLYGNRLSAPYLTDESSAVRLLIGEARIPQRDRDAVDRIARKLVQRLRQNRSELGGLDAFMDEYDLSSREGVVLMCLAEALLRIPDEEVADRLIADKLADADFEQHLGHSDSMFVNATTWALMLTGELVHAAELEQGGLGPMLARLVGRIGEPVIRTAMRQAMRIMAQQFVMGRTIGAAIERSAKDQRYRYSYDMLGEAALTAEDAEQYTQAYADAITVVGRAVDDPDDLMGSPSVSVKLSALCPRFEYSQASRAVHEITERLSGLAVAARDAQIALTVDAEEADRLELTLEVFQRVYAERALKDWPALGIAIQGYQTRALHVLEWLEALATTQGRVIPVRLVKGAYWDTEIKRAQEQGLAGYPVFTRKSSTDASYLAAAKRLLQASPHLYPQFATHNAHTVAWILHVGAKEQFEFQRLHGMGEDLYAEIVGSEEFHRPCRCYAPVGSHDDLLPYLVRRLLENGANTSFVNRIVDAAADLDDVVKDPVEVTAALGDAIPHPKIPLPSALFGSERDNSAGLNLADSAELMRLAGAMPSEPVADTAPLVSGQRMTGESYDSMDPANPTRLVGRVLLADGLTAFAALDVAAATQQSWQAVPVAERARRLRAAATLLEAQRAELVALCVAEAGRTVADALAELREAVDFLRYYAGEAERLLGQPAALPGPTGESNTLRLLGRGPFLCISPWNFPLAIFTGQVAAALAAGNTVIAKPALQTSIVAGRIIELLHAAGIPSSVLHFVPGQGPVIGEALLPDPRLAGVVFTGSTLTAQRIARDLAERDGPLATLIAETGGINAMIVDSSALPEQVVRDALYSAFNSAGQRCSALRLLCLQEDTADRIIEMLPGAMRELSIGDPRWLRTDVGPVIDANAQTALRDYVRRKGERTIFQCALDSAPAAGHFFPPTLIELDSVEALHKEVFGPVLHVLRYQQTELDELVERLNAVGYGLTLGVHSRVDAFAERIAARARVGNVYVNRNMIGAVVGVQPFGGMGLSGTGPKAGGPHYLLRFLTEQTLTINTSAVGGNASLLTLADESPAV